MRVSSAHALPFIKITATATDVKTVYVINRSTFDFILLHICLFPEQSVTGSVADGRDALRGRLSKNQRTFGDAAVVMRVDYAAWEFQEHCVCACVRLRKGLQ